MSSIFARRSHIEEADDTGTPPTVTEAGFEHVTFVLESKCLTHSANLPDDVLDEESERSVGRGNRGSFGPTGTPFLLSVADCEEPKPSVVFRLHVLSCNSRLALEVKRLLQN